MLIHNFHQRDLRSCHFLVTGGAGFIGSHLVEYLLNYGAATVRVLDNFSTGSRENLKSFDSNAAFELVEGDIRDLATCRQSMEGIHYVLHQAALGSVPRSINEPVTTNEVNITGFLNILVAAMDAGVKRMVYAASSSTYGDHPGLPKMEDEIGNPLSPYAVTKYVNELYAGVFSKTYNFHTIGLRYFNVFGPRQNPQGPYAAVIPLFIESALNKQAAIINGDGESSRDFTYVENVVQANIRSLFSDSIVRHEVINIACGHSTTLNQLWQSVNDIVGTDIKATYRDERKGDVKHSLACIDKAKKFIGYDPTVFIDESLRLSVEWYHQLPENVSRT